MVRRNKKKSRERRIEVAEGIGGNTANGHEFYLAPYCPAVEWRYFQVCTRKKKVELKM